MGRSDHAPSYAEALPEPALQTPCVAEASDVPRLAAILAAAFAGYPLTEWVVLRDARSAQRRHAYFELLLGEGCRNGRIVCDEGGHGAAVWFPPGRWSVGVSDFLRTLPAWLRVTGLRALSSRLHGLYALTQQRPPEGDAWSLEVLGVHPSAQRRGVGSRLVEYGLEQARRDGVGAFLLTSSSEVLPFYARFGFSVANELTVPGGPPMWSLWRRP
jgi:GNAT superfamily N-acetyltransferase